MKKREATNRRNFESLETRLLLTATTDLLLKLDAFSPTAASLGGQIILSPGADRIRADLPVFSDSVASLLDPGSLIQTAFVEIGAAIPSQVADDAAADQVIKKLNEIDGLTVVTSPLSDPGSQDIELELVVSLPDAALSPASGLKDFGFGGSGDYLSNLQGAIAFSGDAMATFGGAELRVTFGVTDPATPKFYLAEGDLFSGTPKLTADATLAAGAQVKILDLPFTADFGGAAEVSTTFQVTLDSPIGTRLLEGRELARLADHVSSDVDGNVSFSARCYSPRSGGTARRLGRRYRMVHHRRSSFDAGSREWHHAQQRVFR